MRRGWLACVLAVVLTACGGESDSDRDGLSDRLESRLALAHFPVLHEYADGTARDECPQPRQRPVIYRARPRLLSGDADMSTVAITYLLLYEEDCGALGHPGDSEAFTVFIQRDGNAGQWRTAGAIAIAHQGSMAEKVSVGGGSHIWISRNKHANFATFESCGESDIPGDVCSEEGPAPVLHALLNAGEPGTPVGLDAGDALLDAGANPARTEGTGSRRDPDSAHAYQLFRGQRIWDHRPFFEAGSLAAQLVLDRDLTAPLAWNAERRR